MDQKPRANVVRGNVVKAAGGPRKENPVPKASGVEVAKAGAIVQGERATGEAAGIARYARSGIARNGMILSIHAVSQ
jgi:hypothetical protein